MYYNNHEPAEAHDPERTASKALDDREEEDLLEKAAWNSESEPVAHL